MFISKESKSLQRFDLFLLMTYVTYVHFEERRTIS